MLPFGRAGDGDKSDIERALDRFVDGGMETMKTVLKNAAMGQQEQKSAVPVAKKDVKPKKTSYEGWSVTPHRTKRGKNGKIIRIGPFSMFLADGDEAKKKAAFEAINTIFRTDEIRKVAAKI
jgi:hypothetical protein